MKYKKYQKKSQKSVHSVKNNNSYDLGMDLNSYAELFENHFKTINNQNLNTSLLEKRKANELKNEQGIAKKSLYSQKLLSYRNQQSQSKRKDTKKYKSKKSQHKTNQEIFAFMMKKVKAIYSARYLPDNLEALSDLKSNYHGKTLINKRFKQYLVFQVLQEKINKGQIDVLDLDYNKLSTYISNIKINSDQCQQYLQRKKLDMYYQEFQFFANSIDLKMHLTKRKQLFERLKNSVEAKYYKKFGLNYSNVINLISDEDVFEFLKTEKINKKFLADLEKKIQKEEEDNKKILEAQNQQYIQQQKIAYFKQQQKQRFEQQTKKFISQVEPNIFKKQRMQQFKVSNQIQAQTIQNIIQQQLQNSWLALSQKPKVSKSYRSNKSTYYMKPQYPIFQFQKKLQQQQKSKNLQDLTERYLQQQQQQQIFKQQQINQLILQKREIHMRQQMQKELQKTKPTIVLTKPEQQRLLSQIQNYNQLQGADLINKKDNLFQQSQIKTQQKGFQFYQKQHNNQKQNLLNHQQNIHMQNFIHQVQKDPKTIQNIINVFNNQTNNIIVTNNYNIQVPKQYYEYKNKNKKPPNLIAKKISTTIQQVPASSSKQMLLDQMSPKQTEEMLSAGDQMKNILEQFHSQYLQQK